MFIFNAAKHWSKMLSILDFGFLTALLNSWVPTNTDPLKALEDAKK